MGSKIIGKKREDVLTISSKSRQKALPMSKLWPSLQSARYLRQEASSRRTKLFPPREKLQREVRLRNTAAPCKPTSLTAEDFQQANRDLQPYGKNQFSIRYQKTGTDHTLKVNPVMIHGEPVLSISALKVPLCRQRFLRVCPLYLSHSDRTGKKIQTGEKKEVQMISAHGNNSLVLKAGACVTTAALLLGGIAMEKKAKVRFYEKKYSQAFSSVQIKNQLALTGSDEALKIDK